MQDPMNRLEYRSRSNVISGNLAGKTLHCVIRAGGAFPSAGTYEIGPLRSDPIFGKFALLMPVGGVQGKGAPASIGAQIDAGPRYAARAMADGGKVMANSSARAISGDGPARAITGDRGAKGISDNAPARAISGDRGVSAISGDAGSPERSRQLFVLSGAPISGRNNLVIVQGLSDFEEALELAGGAYVDIE
jgi:hypothetical protein